MKNITTKTFFYALGWTFGLFWLGLGCAASAEEISVAVAANFTAPMQKIASQFEASTGHKIVLTFGASGSLYAQIQNGAPFDVLLSADQETPELLEKKNDAVKDTQFTYAIGKLVLWSPKAGLVDAQGDILKKGDFQHLAVADSKLAPYGRAAYETMSKLGLLDSLTLRLVIGEDISQTYQFISAGNAELGFVALSQVMLDGATTGSVWMVPEDLYQPIRQDAVLLLSGQGRPVVLSFLNYLKTSTARAIMQSYGYKLP